MLPADLDGVAKSGRGKQRRRRPFALDQRVRNQRWPVNQGAALPCFYRAVLQRGSERIFNSDTGVARRRQSLADDGRAVFTDQQQVGKRTADINAHSIHKESRVPGLGSSVQTRRSLTAARKDPEAAASDGQRRAARAEF